MGLFSQKRGIPLSEIIDSLLTALNDAREMQQLRQIQSLESFMDAKTGAPIVKRLKIGEQEIEIPLSSLFSRDSMEIKEVNVSFQVRIKDLATRAIATHSMAGKPLTYDDLRFTLENTIGGNESVMINIYLTTFENKIYDK